MISRDKPQMDSSVTGYEKLTKPFIETVKRELLGTNPLGTTEKLDHDINT